MSKITKASSLLGIPEEDLSHILNHMDQYVKKGCVTKKNGKLRRKYKVISPLKEIQNEIKLILNEIELPLEFHGIKGTSAKTNASVHVNKKNILSIDIRHYFPSIKREKVCWLFSDLGYSRDLAKVLAELTTYNEKLATGFSTSQIIANLIFFKTLYPRIKGLCDQQEIEFSIYADDVTFSSNRNLGKYKNLLRKIFNDEGFEINEDKVKLSKKGEHQEVTGYVVNEKVNIKKEEYDKVRTLLYRCSRDGIEKATNMDREKARSHLLGRINRVLEVNQQRGEKLKKQFNSLFEHIY